MKQSSRQRLRRLWIVPPVAVGVAVLALQMSGRETPQQAPPTEVAQPVRTITVHPTTFVPRAIGHGQVQPSTVWEAVAEVSGRIVYRHPELQRGQPMEAGTVLVRIDSADYELTVARIDASLESVAAELAELEVTGANTRATLEIVRRGLDLADSELERQRTLLARGTASQTAVDSAEQTVLSQRQQVQDLENQLRLLPVQRRVLEAQRTQHLAEREEALLDLERTTLTMPIDGRIAEVNIEEAQYVNVGEVLAVVDGIDEAEVNAQFAVDQLTTVFSETVSVATLSVSEMAEMPDRLAISAEVRFAVNGQTISWAARLDRGSDTIDPQTRTAGVIVVVDEPYRQAVPGVRPPLVKNMYVEVELRGAPQRDRLVVPRTAVHGLAGATPLVYVATAEDRLAMRPVTLGPTASDVVVVLAGLNADDRVVVSDMVPAIDGMLLAPTEDAVLAAALVAEATAGVAP